MRSLMLLLKCKILFPVVFLFELPDKIIRVGGIGDLHDRILSDFNVFEYGIIGMDNHGVDSVTVRCSSGSVVIRAMAIHIVQFLSFRVCVAVFEPLTSAIVRAFIAVLLGVRINLVIKCPCFDTDVSFRFFVIKK